MDYICYYNFNILTKKNLTATMQDDVVHVPIEDSDCDQAAEESPIGGASKSVFLLNSCEWYKFHNACSGECSIQKIFVIIMIPQILHFIQLHTEGTSWTTSHARVKNSTATLVRHRPVFQNSLRCLSQCCS